MRRITDNLDSKFSDESDELADEGISGPERAYRGPHLVFPLQKKDIDTLIEVFRKKKVTIDNKSKSGYFRPSRYMLRCCRLNEEMGDVCEEL